MVERDTDLMRCCLTAFLLWVTIGSVSALNINENVATHLDSLKNKALERIESAHPDNLLNQAYFTNYWIQAIEIFRSASHVSTKTLAGDLKPFQYNELWELNTAFADFMRRRGLLNAEEKEYAQNFVNGLKVKQKVLLPGLQDAPIVYINKSQPGPENGAVEVVFSGKFQSALIDSQHVVARVGGSEFKPTSFTGESITFSIPNTALAMECEGKMFSYTFINLVVPYEEKVMLKKRRREATSQLAVIVLPEKLLLGSYGYKIYEDLKIIETKRTRTYYQQSTYRDLKRDYCIPAHPGWELVKSSVKLVPEKTKGRKGRDWYFDKFSRNNTVCYTVTTIHDRYHASGAVNLHLAYDLKKEKEVVDSVERKISLSWGESIEIDTTGDDWEGTIKDLEGHVYQIKDLTEDMKWFTIQKEGPKIIISAKLPDPLIFKHK